MGWPGQRCTAFGGIAEGSRDSARSVGRARTVFMLLAMVIALGALLACWTAYVRQELHEHIAKAPPANPITMVTLTAAVVLFVIVPIAMNVVSKILAFVTALSLFFPEWFTRWRRSQPDPGIEQAADASELQPQAA
jgi:ACR3 family arsenite efflux pump ArsB